MDNLQRKMNDVSNSETDLAFESFGFKNIENCTIKELWSKFLVDTKHKLMEEKNFSEEDWKNIDCTDFSYEFGQFILNGGKIEEDEEK